MRRRLYIKLNVGKKYKFSDRGEVFIGEYIGSQYDFECCVCGKGHKAKCFNIYYNEDEYETFGYGNEHMPIILEEVSD